MATVSIIAGSTGTGKTTSIRGLNPDETVVIQVNAEKGNLPWPKSKQQYNAEKKNFFNIDNYSSVIDCLKAIGNGSKIKNVVVDDAIYIMRKEFFDRAKETGFGKFTDIAVHFKDIITTCGKMRADLNVFLMLHTEPVFSDGTQIGYKLSTVGKLLDEKFNPMELVSVALFSAVKFEDGKPTYGFYTNSQMEKGCVIPAKSPMGMFEESFIPNDLGYVVKKFEEYY